MSEDILTKKLPINPNVVGLGVSPTLAINEKSSALLKMGKTVYRFGLGQSPFPVPNPIVQALKLYAKEKDYLPVNGLQVLQEAVSKFHRDKDLCDISPSNVLIGPGSKELLFLLQLVFSGEVFIISPSWVSYHPQAHILGKKIKVIHTSFEEKWLLTPDKLDGACKGLNSEMKLLILNYPGNPDGMTYNQEQLSQLAEVARRNNIIILSDEIYGQIDHTGNHVSLARYYPEGTIISSGLSKWCGAGGWRLGTFSFPENLNWLMNHMAFVASETYTSVSAPIQYAAVLAFNGSSEIEDYLWHIRRILSLLGNKIANDLKECGVRLYNPMGGFYLFLDFENFREKLKKRGIIDSEQVCDSLLNDCGVALLPGQSFNRPPGELSARLAYVDFDGEKALSASKTIPLHSELPEFFLEQYCHNVLFGTKKIIEWLNQD